MKRFIVLGFLFGAIFSIITGINKWNLKQNSLENNVKANCFVISSTRVKQIFKK